MIIHHSSKHDATELQTTPSECALCIGTFDGMHQGHQALLQATLDAAKEHKLASAMLTFDPAPGSFFNHDDSIARIMSIAEKENYLQEKNLQHFICLEFNAQLANLGAEEFIEKILKQQLKAKIIIVGDDFRFGKNRQGDTLLLKKLSTKYNYKLIIPDTVQKKEKRISSSWLRETLQNNDLNLVGHLLGRPYAIEGAVVKGDQRGRQLGFPTANIAITQQRPLHGVFVVAATWQENKKNIQHYGVANLGSRPSVDGKRTFLEVHLFNFNDDIYDKLLQISFLHYIRAEKKFSSLEELTKQITADAGAAEKWLRNNKD